MTNDQIFSGTNFLALARTSSNQMHISNKYQLFSPHFDNTVKIIGVTHQELVENGRSSVFSGEMHKNQNLRLTRKQKKHG